MFVTQCSWYFQVFLSKLLLVSSYFSKLLCYWGKKICQWWRLNWRFIFIAVIIASYCEGKSLCQVQTVQTSVQNSKATIYIKITVLSFLISPTYSFPWRETSLFTCQIKAQIGKRTLIILFIKGKTPTLAGNKHFSVDFSLHGPRLSHLLTEKVPIRSIGYGHQSGYFLADAISNNINIRWKTFSIKGNY